MNVTIRIGNDDGRPCCQMKSKNSAPATLCSICGGRSPSSSAVPMKLAEKPIISTSGVAGMLERARQRQRDRRHHQDADDVIDEHRQEAGQHRQHDDQEARPAARQLQRLHRQPARHAGAAEVAGDDPDADQDRHHVPVDQLRGLDLGHGAHPDHDADAEQRCHGGVELVDDDSDDRHREHGKRQPLQQGQGHQASPMVT